LLVVLLQLPLKDVGTVTAAFSIVEAQLAIAARSNGHTWATNYRGCIVLIAIGIRNFQTLVCFPTLIPPRPYIFTQVLNLHRPLTINRIPTVVTTVLEVSNVLRTTHHINDLGTG